MWINCIQLPVLLIIDLFVFFFIKKIFFKFNKNSIVCSICLPNRHIITRSRTLVYTSYTNICNRLCPNKFIINFSDLICTSLLVASGTQMIDFVYMCYFIKTKLN